MKIIKIAIKAIGIVVSLLIFVYLLGGLLIPAENTFSTETRIDARREVVWKVLTDREKYVEWQDKLESVEIKDNKTWVEVTKDAGPLDFRMVRAEAPKLLELEYSTVSGVSGHWIGKLEETQDGGTLLRTTDRNTVTSWIAKIFMYAFFDLEEFAKEWNKKLKARAETIERRSNEGGRREDSVIN